jgi:hypothetical protein
MSKYSASRISSTCSDTTLESLEYGGRHASHNLRYGLVPIDESVALDVHRVGGRCSPASALFESLLIPFEFPDEHARLAGDGA